MSGLPYCRRMQVEICLVSLVDAERQWFKSHVVCAYARIGHRSSNAFLQGLGGRETHRNFAFCGHVIVNREVAPLRGHGALMKCSTSECTVAGDGRLGCIQRSSVLFAHCDILLCCLNATFPSCLSATSLPRFQHNILVTEEPFIRFYGDHRRFA